MAAAFRCFFPGSAIGSGFVRPSSRRAVAAPLREAEPAASLGHRTRVDFPILHQILLTVAEHHSAILPWQFVSQKTGATLKYVGLTREEVPDIEQLKGLLSNKTKMVVVHHVSNVLGSMLPIEEIVTWSKRVGAKVLVDACQSVPHMPVDVQKLGADFLVASSHKHSHTVAIRPGNHCAQILHRTLGIDASARASLYFYNTKEEVDVFIHALKDTIDFLTCEH
nr:unnamed protein product [Digitaria exilis]